MWADIFVANRAALGRSLDAFRSALDDLARTLAAGSREEIRAALARIKTAREALP
jgi:prephenate dehydrogenase